jgi:hypothetical protein
MYGRIREILKDKTFRFEGKNVIYKMLLCKTIEITLSF